MNQKSVLIFFFPGVSTYVGARGHTQGSIHDPEKKKKLPGFRHSIAYFEFTKWQSWSEVTNICHIGILFFNSYHQLQNKWHYSSLNKSTFTNKDWYFLTIAVIALAKGGILN